MLIGISVIAGLIIPDILSQIPSERAYGGRGPAPHSCGSDFSCAENRIMTCRTDMIFLTYGERGDALEILVMGWEGDMCHVKVRVLPYDSADAEKPFHICAADRDDLASWTGWRDSAADGFSDIENRCTPETANI